MLGLGSNWRVILNMRKVYKTRRDRRRAKLRARIKGRAGQPRLVVFRSNKYIYSQIIDDEEGKTLVVASDFDLKPDRKKATLRALKGAENTEGSVPSEKLSDSVLRKKHSKTELARFVGKILAQKALKKGIKAIVFDRAGYKYHGRVKALADGAKEGGLEF